MNEPFYKERARQVRAIAETADPFTRKRLLELANRYEGSTPRRLTRLPTVSVEDNSNDQHGGGNP
jgi:hypothetical protein